MIITARFAEFSFQITIGSGSSVGEGLPVGEDIGGSGPDAGGSGQFSGDIDRFKISTVEDLGVLLFTPVDAGTDFEDNLTKFFQGGF